MAAFRNVGQGLVVLALAAVACGRAPADTQTPGSTQPESVEAVDREAEPAAAEAPATQGLDEQESREPAPGDARSPDPGVPPGRTPKPERGREQREGSSGSERTDADDRPVSEPRSLDEAQAELARAERTLVALLEPPSQSAGKSRRSAADSEASAPRSKPKKGAPSTDCKQVCRAYSSMLRATAAICRMDGEAGARCKGAKKTVDRYRARVMNCGC
jgi:hypothetical protein